MGGCKEKKRPQSNRGDGPDLRAPAQLETQLGYHFKDGRLLETALTHPTYAHEHPAPAQADNQRLEFLGDAVLNLIVGHLLMMHAPNAREGELTRMRARLVSETGLCAQARELDLGAYIRLGAGELATHGREKKSILADTLEAVMAAVYLDGGFAQTFTIVQNLFSPLLGAPENDTKTALQELAQKKMRMAPVYRVLGETGPAHEKMFTVELILGDIITTGTGKSKKRAEKSAAGKALKKLSNRED